MQQARSRGVKATFVGPNLGLVNPRLYALSKGAAKGLIVSTNQSDDDSKYQSFKDAFTQKFGKLEDPISAYGYDSVMVLAKAIEKAGSSDRGAIRDALESMTDVCASICYRADGSGNLTATGLFYQELDADGWKPLTA
jgi:branched-chain amino acid transport system substrate-binding protein